MLKFTMEPREAETRYGVMQYYDDDRFIGRALEQYGEYSEAEPSLWRRFLKPGDTVVDVGANIGCFTLALAEIVGDGGKVLAIEPQPENFRLLSHNAGGLANVLVVHVALGSTRGTIRVPALADVVNNNYGGVELGFGDDEVEVATLDECCPDGSRVAFVKVDVEGMEGDVLRGAVNTIRRDRPILYVENDRQEKAEALRAQIRSLGYRLYQHAPSLYSADNFRGVPVTDVQNIVSLNLLCVPDERNDELVASGATRDLARLDAPPSRTVSNKGWAGIVRLGGIGDNLIAASVLRPLKAAGYMVEVISQEPQACVFENNPYIDKLTVKSARELPQDGPINWQKYWWSRSCEFSKFVNLSHSVEVLMARFPAETAFWWPPEFRRKMCGHSYLEAAHDVVGVPHTFGPLFFPTDEEKADIAAFKERHKLCDKPLVAWVISGTRVDKLYQYAAFAVARLISELDVNVVMMSAPAPARPDVNYAKQIMDHVQLTNSSTRGLYEVRHVDGQHDWPIRRMLTLAQMTDLVISPDTGVAWAVAMEPLPKVILHSHAGVDNITKNWKNTYSLRADPSRVPCHPCHLLHDQLETCTETQLKAGMKVSPDDIGAACIRDISVDHVLAASRAALGRGPSRVLAGTTTVLRP